MDSLGKPQAYYLGVVQRCQGAGKLAPYEGKPSERFNTQRDSLDFLKENAVKFPMLLAVAQYGPTALHSLTLTLDRSVELNKEVPNTFDSFWKNASICVDCGISSGTTVTFLQRLWKATFQPGPVVYASDMKFGEIVDSETAYDNLIKILRELHKDWRKNRAVFSEKLPELRNRLDTNVGELIDRVERYGKPGGKVDLADWRQVVQRLPVNAVTLGSVETLSYL